MSAQLFAGRNVKRGFVLLASALLFSSVVLCALAGGKGNQNPGVLPPNSRIAGLTYGEWGAEWWQWLLAIPATDAQGNITNPILATGDVDLSMAQPAGDVWYLTGAIQFTPIEVSPGVFEATVERSGQVPAGKKLFFPLLNGEWDNIGLPDGDFTIAELAAMLAESIDAGEPYAIIDGVPVAGLNAYRAAFPGAFTYQLPDAVPPARNIYQYLLGDPSDPLNFWNYAVGPISENPAYNPAEPATPPDGGNCPFLFSNDPVPAVSDGYWLMLTPLPVGQHTIEFGGTMPWITPAGPGTFTIQIKYTIDVVPGAK
jgi:hypothetical protein